MTAFMATCILLLVVILFTIHLCHGARMDDSEDGIRSLMTNATSASLNISTAESITTLDNDPPSFNVVINNGGFSQIGGTSIASGVSNGPGNGNSGGGTVAGIITDVGKEFNDGGGDVKWLVNCDFPGYDIGRLRSPGEECGGICIANLQCTHFSHTNDGYCYMKKAPLRTSHATSNGGMCGFIPWRFDPEKATKNWNVGEGGVKWLRNCDFSGYDIRRQIASPEDCGSICIANSRCTHFRHLDNDQYCYLKNAPSATSRIPTNGGICGLIPWRL